MFPGIQNSEGGSLVVKEGLGDFDVSGKAVLPVVIETFDEAEDGFDSVLREAFEPLDGEGGILASEGGKDGVFEFKAKVGRLLLFDGVNPVEGGIEIYEGGCL